jgi:hypothetical protein
LRGFWLTSFAIGAAAVLVAGWRGGQPWTAAVFVVFFVSRVARSLIKRPLTRARNDDPVRRAQRFIAVTVVGWCLSGILAAIASFAGEGLEWLYVAPFFLVMAALNFYVLVRSTPL